MAIEDKNFEYFRSVNPIAQKIAEDIDNIKEKNRSCWNTLEAKAKDKIIDDVLIDNSLVKKYENTCDMQYEDLEPLSSFSWFSRSQLNLFTYSNVKPERNKTPMKKTDVLSPQKKTKNVSYKVSENPSKHIKNKNSKDEKLPEKICSKSLAKPKTPPPPPPSKLVIAGKRESLENQNPDDIPKTGFDFLDNW